MSGLLRSGGNRPLRCQSLVAGRHGIGNTARRKAGARRASGPPDIKSRHLELARLVERYVVQDAIPTGHISQPALKSRRKGPDFMSTAYVGALWQL